MHSHRLRVLSPALILAGLSGSVLGATPVVVSNTSNLLPNTAGQQIELFISGTDQIAGENINVQTNGGTSGPTITGIDIIDGTIFGGNTSTGPGGQGIVTSGSYSGHIAIVSTTTNTSVTPTVQDNGLFLTLTVSTVGTPGTTFQLNLINTLNGSSNLLLSDATKVFFTGPDVNFSIGTADRQWLVNGSNTWSPDANWTPFAPYAPGDAADFYGALTTATTATVTVDGPKVVGAINFNNTIGSYALIPQNATVGSLELNNGPTLAPMINDSAGSHSIATPILLDSNTAVTNTNVTVMRAGDNLTLSGNISGSASLTFAGLGVTVLAGSNSYGATNISPGATVQVGAGSNTGTLGTGAVTDNGTLVFDRSDLPSISNQISGSGGLTNVGTGTVSLTAAVNIGGSVSTGAGLLDFSGGVTHNVGPVNIGAGGLKVDPGTTLVSGAVSAQSTGTWTIAGTDQIRQGLLTAGTSVINALPTFVGSGTLDITDDKLIVQSTGATGNKASLISSLETLVNQGKGTGNWTGSGITSSVVANDVATATNHTYHTTVAIADNASLITPFTTYGGQPVNTNSILVTRALIGDGNLDGTVNNADVVVLLTHYGLNNETQSGGDFTGDGTVNNADVVALLTDYGQSLPGGFSVAPAGSGGGGGTSPAPEPASLAVLAAGGAALLARRRRRPSLK